MRRLIEKLLGIDRRFIFLVMGLVIAIPIIRPFGLKMDVTRPTRLLFDEIERIDPDTQCLMVATDYTPQTEPELAPMLVGLLRHAFARKIPVLVLTFYIEAAGLAVQGIEQVVDEFNARATSSADSVIYGRDLVYLGWTPPPIVPILGMGTSILNVYVEDWYGNRTEDLPVMRRIHTYDEVGVVVSLSSISAPIWFVQLAQTRFGVKVAGGVTAVSVADFYPYLETGQLCGMLGGMKGAAEYEELVETVVEVPGRRKATEGMSSQSAAHVAIMAFVVLGNVGYFLTRRKR
jgi:hypothetical protein